MAHLSRRDGRSIQSEIRSYFTKLEGLFSSSEWKSFKDSSASFSRNGPLSPSLLIVFLLYLVADSGRRGYKNLLDSFWDECQSFGIELPTDDPVSAAAFCKARRKLKPESLLFILQLANKDFYKRHPNQFLWKGSRVLACDGTKISTQRTPALSEALGTPSQGSCPQVQVSTLYDVMAGLPIDLTAGPYAADERGDLISMLDHVNPNDILILDRGYPGSMLIEELLERDIQFLIRVKSSKSFKAIEDFVASNGRDRNVEITPNRKKVKNKEPFRLRAVRHKRNNSDGCAVFITNIKKDKANYREIEELYSMRWAIEELYKIEKGAYLGQGSFHAKNEEGVHQEIYAFALFVALTRSMMAKAAKTSGVSFEKISQKAALLALGSYVTRVFVDPNDKDFVPNIARLIQRISRNLDPPRPGRSFPRRSYRPTPRWNSKGKNRKKKNVG